MSFLTSTSPRSNYSRSLQHCYYCFLPRGAPLNMLLHPERVITLHWMRQTQLSCTCLKTSRIKNLQTKQFVFFLSRQEKGTGLNEASCGTLQFWSTEEMSRCGLVIIRRLLHKLSRNMSTSLKNVGGLMEKCC